MVSGCRISRTRLRFEPVGLSIQDRDYHTSEIAYATFAIARRLVRSRCFGSSFVRRSADRSLTDYPCENADIQETLLYLFQTREKVVKLSVEKCGRFLLDIARS